MASRMINDEFLKDLQPGEILSPVIEHVKEKRLVLAFRGEYINVYYKGHSIYKIIQKKKYRYKIEFDFNHARYAKTWKDDLDSLMRLGFILPEKQDKKMSIHIYIRTVIRINMNGYQAII